jgi:hypothetical protein
MGFVRARWVELFAAGARFSTTAVSFSQFLMAALFFFA